MEKQKENIERKKEMKKHSRKWKHLEQMDAKYPTLLQQCLGPDCVNPTRPGSKYCSDNCGMRLAAARIYEILPQHIQQWKSSPCIAEEHGKKVLNSIPCEQQDIHRHLKDMERQFHELEAIILNGKQQTVCSAEESKDLIESIHQKIFCVSCGKSITMSVALRHMEHCFSKYECKSSFGSLYPTCIEGTTRLFCDVYDPESKRYCKRLQVLCPEHSKDPKVSDDEVCGCPLVHNVFVLTGNFCCLPKRLCSHHCDWEKLRRAQVDLEHVKALYKLEELSKREHKVRTAIGNRAGVLPVMLYQTIQHDLCSGVGN